MVCEQRFAVSKDSRKGKVDQQEQAADAGGRTTQPLILPNLGVRVGFASKVTPSSSRMYFGLCWFTKLVTTPIDF